MQMISVARASFKILITVGRLALYPSVTAPLSMCRRARRRSSWMSVRKPCFLSVSSVFGICRSFPNRLSKPTAISEPAGRCGNFDPPGNVIIMAMGAIDARLYLEEEIFRLKREKKIVLLAHYYQESDIQDLADFVGDS